MVDDGLRCALTIAWKDPVLILYFWPRSARGTRKLMSGSGLMIREGVSCKKPATASTHRGSEASMVGTEESRDG